MASKPLEAPVRTALLSASAAALLLAGCAHRPPANTVELTVVSQPAGAYISEKGSTLAGLAPLVLQYPMAGLTKDKNGCYVVRGFDARWGSGAASSSAGTVLFCGGGQKFHFVLQRNPADPGLDKDLAFALQLDQRQEDRDNALVEGIAAGFAGAMDARNQQRQPVKIAPINCTSRRNISGTVTTDCN